jgi:hypothetical protein
MPDKSLRNLFQNTSFNYENFYMKIIPVLLLLLTFSLTCAAQQLKEGEVPANVRAVASKQNSNQPITMWVLDKKRGKYIATVISNTAVRGIEISLNGNWLETTEGVAPVNLPGPVMKAASEGFPGYELDNFFYYTSPDKAPYYSIDASSDDEDLTLSIDADGKILQKKVR